MRFWNNRPESTRKFFNFKKKFCQLIQTLSINCDVRLGVVLFHQIWYGAHGDYESGAYQRSVYFDGDTVDLPVKLFKFSIKANCQLQNESYFEFNTLFADKEILRQDKLILFNTAALCNGSRANIHMKFTTNYRSSEVPVSVFRSSRQAGISKISNLETFHT